MVRIPPALRRRARTDECPVFQTGDSGVSTRLRYQSFIVPRMLVGQRAVSKAAMPRSNRGRGAIGAKLIRMSMRLLIAR